MPRVFLAAQSLFADGRWYEATPSKGYVQDQAVSAAAEDGAAGEEGKTQGGRLLLGCSAGLYGALGLPEQVESHQHSQKGGLRPPLAFSSSCPGICRRLRRPRTVRAFMRRTISRRGKRRRMFWSQRRTRPLCGSTTPRRWTASAAGPNGGLPRRRGNPSPRSSEQQASA